MKMTLIFISCLLPLLALAGEGQQSDLNNYIEGIKASGISENGRNQIYTIASICTGSMILDYQFDESSGRYWPSYMSATCPKPDADPPEFARWKELMATESDQLVPLLKPFADADGSGFVTTDEASDFRFLIEFGFLAEHVFHSRGANLDALSKASGREPKDAEARLSAYKTLARRIMDSGVAELPFPELANAEDS